MNELHLFAGVGGGILGGIMLGHRPVCAVEIDEYCRSVLVQRQNDGSLPHFPIWDDICTFDATRWRGAVDVVCGGFPCQNISSAGKGTGILGQKSSLWFEMLRVICEVRPKFAFVENSPMLVRRGLDAVLGGLAESGYDAEWTVLPASAVGSPHHRERLWILAKKENESASSNPKGNGRLFPVTISKKDLAEHEAHWGKAYDHLLPSLPTWESNHTGFQSLDDGIPFIVEQLTAVGNAQVPLCVAVVFAILYDRINGGERL